MSTFYIPTPQDADRQEALDRLIDSLTTLYPGLLQASPAIAISTDVPQLAALFKSLVETSAETQPVSPANPPSKPKTSKAARIIPSNPEQTTPVEPRLCRNCGEPILSPDKNCNGFCTTLCKNHYYGARRKKRRNDYAAKHSNAPTSAYAPITKSSTDPILGGEPGVWHEDPAAQGSVLKQLMAEERTHKAKF